MALQECPSILPIGWTWATLQDCVDILDGKRVPINSREREQRKVGKLESALFPYYGATGLVDWIDDFLFDEEIVLLGEDGAPFLEPFKAKAYLIKGKSWVNNHAHVLRAISGLLSNFYLCYYLNTFRYNGFVTGTTRLKLNQALMRKIPIPLAPFSEQLRIVGKVEELFSFLDAGVASLHVVQAQLKRYRQAVLKAAFEGKLTKEWRKSHKCTMEKAHEFLEQFQSEEKQRFRQIQVPEEWAWINLEQLSANIVDCLHSTAKFTEAGKFCIDTTCIETNKILFEKARLVSDETFKERVRRLVPKEGDVFFAREGTIGTAVVVPPTVDLCLGQRMMMFRLRQGIIPFYFTWGLLSPMFEKQWKPKVMGTTAPHVNIKDLRQMVLPVTCPEEQQVIVNEVEAQISVMNNVEKTVFSNLNQIALLRQSILTRAFAGKLVTQDPNDEPAAKLLECISGERRNIKSKNNKLELSPYVE
jgi:type I restriction enzyme, S subunit